MLFLAMGVEHAHALLGSDWTSTTDIGKEVKGSSCAYEAAGTLFRSVRKVLGKDVSRAERVARHTTNCDGEEAPTLPAHTIELICQVFLEEVAPVLEWFDKASSIVVFEGNYVMKSTGPAAEARRLRRLTALSQGNFCDAYNVPDCAVRLICQHLKEKGIKYLFAPAEGEAQVVSLALEGVVRFAVITSNDSDALFYFLAHPNTARARQEFCTFGGGSGTGTTLHGCLLFNVHISTSKASMGHKTAKGISSLQGYKYEQITSILSTRSVKFSGSPTPFQVDFSRFSPTHFVMLSVLAGNDYFKVAGRGIRRAYKIVHKCADSAHVTGNPLVMIAEAGHVTGPGSEEFQRLLESFFSIILHPVSKPDAAYPNITLKVDTFLSTEVPMWLSSTVVGELLANLRANSRVHDFLQEITKMTEPSARTRHQITPSPSLYAHCNCCNLTLDSSKPAAARSLSADIFALCTSLLQTPSKLTAVEDINAGALPSLSLRLVLSYSKYASAIDGGFERAMQVWDEKETRLSCAYLSAPHSLLLLVRARVKRSYDKGETWPAALFQVSGGQDSGTKIESILWSTCQCPIQDVHYCRHQMALLVLWYLLDDTGVKTALKCKWIGPGKITKSVPLPIAQVI